MVPADLALVSFDRADVAGGDRGAARVRVLPVTYTFALSAAQASSQVDRFGMERSLGVEILLLLLFPFGFSPGALLYLRAREAEGNPFSTS